MNTIDPNSTIQQLRTLGWSVRCTYFRYSEDFPFRMRPTYEMKWARRLRARSLDGSVVRNPKRSFREKPTARGGRVEVSLFAPGEHEWAEMATATGVAECSRKDQFVKKLGRELALRRAIEKVNLIIGVAL